MGFSSIALRSYANSAISFLLQQVNMGTTKTPLKPPKQTLQLKYLRFYFEVWNVSCETDLESVMKGD